MEQLVQGTYSLKREQFSSEDLGRASGPRSRPRAAVLAGRPGRRRTCGGAAGRGAPWRLVHRTVQHRDQKLPAPRDTVKKSFTEGATA